MTKLLVRSCIIVGWLGMQLPFSIAYIFGSALLLTPIAAVESSYFPELVYLAGTAEDKQDLETGFNLCSLNIESLMDDQMFAELIEQLLWIDADIVCLQGVETDEIATIFYSALQYRYAHFYLDSQQRMVASRYPIEHRGFVLFALDTTGGAERLFDFFHSPRFISQVANEQYFIDAYPLSIHGIYPGILASIIAKESSNFSSLSRATSLLCKAGEMSQEAKEHRDKAIERTIDALIHAGQAAAVFELMPPAAIFEVYKRPTSCHRCRKRI